MQCKSAKKEFCGSAAAFQSQRRKLVSEPQAYFGFLSAATAAQSGMMSLFILSLTALSEHWIAALPGFVDLTGLTISHYCGERISCRPMPLNNKAQLQANFSEGLRNRSTVIVYHEPILVAPHEHVLAVC